MPCGAAATFAEFFALAASKQRRLLAGSAVLLCLVAVSPPALATSTDPFAILNQSGAGPANWAVLALGGSCGYAGSGCTTANAATKFSFTSGTITGNVGIAPSYNAATPGDNFSITGPSKIEGNVYVDTAGQFSDSANTSVGAGGKQGITGYVYQNSATDELLASAVAGALAASNAASALSSTAGNWSASPFSISSPGSQITLLGGSGLNVVNLINLQLTNSARGLVLSGSTTSQFVINVTGTFAIGGGADITVSGGLQAANVIYNIAGAGAQVSLSGGLSGTTPNTEVDGIILAPRRDVAISPGLVIPEIIGGGSQISVTSGGEISTIPEPVSVVLFGPAVALLWLRKKPCQGPPREIQRK